MDIVDSKFKSTPAQAAVVDLFLRVGVRIEDGRAWCDGIVLGDCAIGRAAGVLAGWNFIISLVAVTGGEALAFSFYFKTLFAAFGVTLPFSDVAIAVVITACFIVANVCGVKLSGRLQNGFMFFFWGVAVIWFLTMIPEVNLPNFVQAPSFLPKDNTMSFAAGVPCRVVRTIGPQDSMLQKPERLGGAQPLE